MDCLYLHIPFCEKICTYCDFAKEVNQPNKKQHYIEALRQEIILYQSHLQSIQTIYVGGGTPSLLNIEELEHLKNALKSTVSMDRIIEFTFECNPNDITREKALKLMDIGVNRISMGVQTFDNTMLEFLNRTHRKTQIKQAIKVLREVGFTNISVDMLFGLPGQTLSDLQSDYRQLMDLDVDHISYYNLILEKNTKLYNLVKKNKVQLLDDELEATMFEWLIENLIQDGYHHYEISNFAKKDKASLHNVLIWKDADYLGLGIGAHSKYHERRYANVSRLKHYLEALNMGNAPEREEYAYEPVRDYLLNGLRLRQGINLKTFEKRFNKSVFDFYPVFKKIIEEGFLAINDDDLYLTHKGLMYGNAIFSLL